MQRLLLVLAGAGCILLTGCGTFSDAMCGPVTDRVYYRGVQWDLDVVKSGGPNVLFVVDIPFSAVADTFLIPHYARLHRNCQGSARLESESAARSVPTATDANPAGVPSAPESE